MATTAGFTPPRRVSLCPSTRCIFFLESSGSAGQMSLPLIDGTRALLLACTFSKRVPSEQEPRTATSLGKLAAGSCHELRDIVVVTRALVKQGLAPPNCERLLSGQSQKYFFLRFRILPLCHHTMTFQLLVNSVFRFTKSRFSVY